MIDTHSHMYLDQFDEDRAACMERAFKENVLLTLLPNIDVDSIEPMKRIMDEFPTQFMGMMGLHPCSVKVDFREQLTVIKEELDTGKYLAVGEIGIDLYWDKSTLGIQVEAFKEQVEWAKEADLPIVIHARDSFDEIFEVLDEVHDERLKGVFHCFTGTAEQGEKALSYTGFYLGIGGVATFKNSGLDMVLSEIGLDRLMLETDAPYLTPHPHRGKRNETAYTRLVADKLAVIFEKSVEEIAQVTTNNAKDLFEIRDF
ncbi:TatD family hydrolase [Cryomorphaceae bacterium 1068]|nr:TatD family hydrolase [Cryomorphaceae bacterium 1068]